MLLLCTTWCYSLLREPYWTTTVSTSAVDYKEISGKHVTRLSYQLTIPVTHVLSSQVTTCGQVCVHPCNVNMGNRYLLLLSTCCTLQHIDCICRVWGWLNKLIQGLVLQAYVRKVATLFIGSFKLEHVTSWSKWTKSVSKMNFNFIHTIKGVPGNFSQNSILSMLNMYH